MAKEKLVEVTVDRDVAEAPASLRFEKVELKGDRVLAITYAKDKANAGDVFAAVQAQGYGIIDVSTREAELEEVFLSLTRAPNAYLDRDVSCRHGFQLARPQRRHRPWGIARDAPLDL